ncbi:MAG: hypothetical protein IKZ20_00245 [Bacteroidaceae bacterium]|nr:hypothetical protein [Bacteroidaceae bacterium]
MKKYIQPTCASIEFSGETLMNNFSMVNKETESDALTKKRKSGWSCDLWTSEEDEF